MIFRPKNPFKKQNNYAFIDGQNLHASIQALGWNLDFKKFREYLSKRYHITKAFYFLGFVEEQMDLYTQLQGQGYIVVFKPVRKGKDGTIKGNVDADLVLTTMIEINNFDKAVIVTGDGDFYSLVDYLNKQNKLEILLIPSKLRHSTLLKKFAQNRVHFISELKTQLTYKRYRK